MRCLQELMHMHRALAHRGPDGEGFLFVDIHQQAHTFYRTPSTLAAAEMQPILSIAFQRLGIQDLRVAARQPLTHGRGQQWIVLNGEIYNFQELRGLLQAEGDTFHTRGDTEVALAAYQCWGTACFEKFNGMWALLIVDLARGVLVGSRDRLGIKPFFYSVDAGRVLFASEPKALVRVQRTGPTLHTSRFVDFLRGSPRQVSAFSFFAGVHPVPAATFFEIDFARQDASVPHFRPYWNLADYTSTAPVVSFEKAKEEFATLLQSAVAYRTVADVPVGSLLSGGLDSSMLTRLMVCSCQRPDALCGAFSLAFDEQDMDESRYVDAVLRLGGIDGHRVKLSPADAWTLIDTVTEAYAEPLLGHYLLAYYRVLQLAHQHGATVILDGQGADELLGGYNPIEAAALREKLLGGHLRDFVVELDVLARQQHRSHLAVLRSHVLQPSKRYLGTRGGRQASGPRYNWLHAPALQADASTEPWGIADDRGSDRSLVNRHLYQLTKYTNLPYLLLFLDRLSMAHGMELRVPYLDHRLVEFCFKLPASYKIAFGNRKRLLREMARGYLPEVVTGRTYKMGIASNLQWLPAPALHGEALRQMIHSTTMRHLPWLSHAPAVRFVEDYLAHKHHDALAVWRLYTAWRWLEIFRPTLTTGVA